MLLYTLKHPKCVLGIWLQSYPHIRRNIRQCSNVYKKNAFLHATPSLPSPVLLSSHLKTFHVTETYTYFHDLYSFIVF